MTESKEVENPRLRPAYIVGGIAGLIIITISLLAFSDDKNEIFWGNLTIGATAAMSLGAGMLLLSKTTCA